MAFISFHKSPITAITAALLVAKKEGRRQMIYYQVLVGLLFVADELLAHNYLADCCYLVVNYTALVAGIAPALAVFVAFAAELVAGTHLAVVALIADLAAYHQAFA